MGLGNIKLKTGMSMLVGLSILAMVGLGGFAILEMRQQYRILAINHKSSEVDSAFRAEVQAWQSLLLRAADMTAYNQNLKEFNAQAQTVDEKLTALANYVSEIGVKVDVEGHEQKLEEHFQKMLEMHQDIQTKYHTALTKYPDRSMSGWHRFTDWEVRGVDKPFTQSLQEMEQVLGAAIQADLARVNVEMALAVLIFVVAIILASAVLIRQFTRPLVKLMDAARRMGEGDMTVRLNMDGGNEIGALARVLDNTAAGLGKLALNTRMTADSLRSTSVEMSSAVATQSRGASEQAAAVTEVTTTLEQIRDISHTTLDKVRLLEDAAQRVNTHGEAGSRAVAMTITAMEKIRRDMKAVADTIIDLADQTRQIGDITGAVQTLAQQSKMLALNASIEASKAGEAGKGFAVVAGEVRHLAEQSENATGQVKDILDQIQKATERAVMAAEEGAKTVDEGNRMVEQAGAAVAELRGVINETAQVSHQITQAVSEEATGIQQASGSMGEISRVINHFAAATQQNESAAGEVGKLAQRIQDGVSAYKVNLQAAE